MQKNEALRIHADMKVSEIMALLPEGGPLLAEYGLHCFGCAANALETLREGCVGHGFSDEEIAALTDDLNTMLCDRPQRPETLEITVEAAKTLLLVLQEQGKPDAVLRVLLDANGGFCMEFADRVPAGDLVFAHREVPQVRLSAASATLQRIGGSTVDFREGRFKLDLAADLVVPACGCDGVCRCGDRKNIPS